LAQHYANQSSRTGGELRAVGYGLGDDTGILLCTDPSGCELTKPSHSDTCTGALKQLAGNDLFMVACRGLVGGPGTSTDAMGKDRVLNPVDDDERGYVWELNSKAQEILNSAKDDPQAAFAYYRSLSQATQAQLNGAHPGLETWSKGMWDQIETSKSAPVWLSKDKQDDLLGNARPKKFEKAWTDDYWRNVFWQWFMGPGRATPGQEALLTLYDKMSSWYDSKDDESAREIVDFCRGGSGAAPACDAGAVDAVSEALENESGVKSAMDGLWDSVVGQLDMVFPAFYEDVGKLKDAIR
jgi:hypothetical protein